MASLRVIRRSDTGTFQIVGTVAKQRIRMAAGTSNKRLAQERAASIEAELLRTAWFGERRDSDQRDRTPTAIRLANFDVEAEIMAEGHTKETPREAFKRISAKRLADACHALHLLSLCADQTRYEFTEAEAQTIKREISHSVRLLFDRFDGAEY